MTADMTDEDKQAIYKDFRTQVNMTAGELKQWLATDDSKSVGIKQGTSSDKKDAPGGTESTGHASGEQIITILQTNKSDLSDEMYAHMKKVHGYIKRHSAQKPDKDIEGSRWRYSLMNWGHDPIKVSK